MKKKLFCATSALLIFGAVTVLPVSAAVDPYASTSAYIGWSVNYSNKIVGKAYAITNNPNMTQLNVAGSFYQGGTLKESGTGSTTTKGYEADWLTKDGVYADNVTATVNAASRTYYSGGSYDQQYSTYTW